MYHIWCLISMQVNWLAISHRNTEKVDVSFCFPSMTFNMGAGVVASVSTIACKALEAGSILWIIFVRF